MNRSKRRMKMEPKQDSKSKVAVHRYELVVKIFSYLPIKDLGRCAQVSKMFYTNAYDTSLWEKISIRGTKNVFERMAITDYLNILLHFYNP